MNRIRLGLLHSLSGTMALSEAPLVKAAQLAIDEINASGGVLGQQIESVLEDGRSDPDIFAQKARKLLCCGAAAIFGCWNSSARKAVRPVVEAHDSQLWYPIQYEGLEESRHIFYTGACLNQQIIPGVEWALNEGYPHCFIVGSDYVFPRTANSLIGALYEEAGGEVLSDCYVPLGETDFSVLLDEVKAQQPDIIFNTLNGGSNLAFFRQYHEAGFRAEEAPVMSFSITETEQHEMAREANGHLACWSYFETDESPENEQFLLNHHARHGNSEASSDPIVTAYSQVHLWARIAEKAGSFEAPVIRRHASEEEFLCPLGKMKICPNNHVSRRALIGRANATGAFDVIWKSDSVIAPKPWLGLEDLSGPSVAMLKRAASMFPEALHRTSELEIALRHVHTLRGLLPICSNCKKIRDDDGYWTEIETYITTSSDASFSHGVCPACAKKLYPTLNLENREIRYNVREGC